jgi:large subunit ribosomal protein L36
MVDLRSKNLYNTTLEIDEYIKISEINIMKVLKSLKSAKTRDKNCRIVKRKGRTLVINKVNKRFKAKQA